MYWQEILQKFLNYWITVSLYKMQKRIIFLTNLPLWSMERNKGGRAFSSTFYGYINAGWDVWLVTTDGYHPENLPNNVHVCLKKFPVLTKLSGSSNKIIRVFFKYLKFASIHFFLYFEACRVLKMIGRKSVVIYGYEVDGILPAKRISQRWGIPLVTRFQGTVHSSISDNLFNKVRFFPHLSALKVKANIAIMTNDGTQGLKTLNRLGNRSDKIFFWRNGVALISEKVIEKSDIYRRELNIDDKFMFLTVSRLVNWKRVDRAIYAFAEVWKKYPQSLLLIIGDGNSRSDLESLVEKLGIARNVIFTGAIEQQKVYKYMVATDVFLSLYDLSNVGNPLLEAMMCGKAIITLNNGDTSELIHNKETGILLQPDQPSMLVKSMIELIEDKELLLKLGVTARKYAENNFWDWRRRIDTEIEEVEKLVKK